MKKGFGIFLVIISGMNLIQFFASLGNSTDSSSSIARFLILITVAAIGGWMIYSVNKKEKEEAKIFLEKRSIQIKELNEKKEQEINAKIEKLDKFKEQIEQIKELNVLPVDDYKKVIIDNEKIILEKGGEKQLYSFLKIDSFLKDYRGRIISDSEDLKNLIDINDIKNKIIKDSKRDNLDKLHENLQSNLAKLENKKAFGFDANLESIFNIGRFIQPTLENQIKTLEFYKNMAISMIVFYQNDKKIRYFEIYEAFEKLGVFDSTWQKNVLNKLDKIEVRLAQISNQLTDLNQNFISLIESSENIVSELKEVNSNIMTNNMLQTITAYQTWKINRNTKVKR